MTNRQSRSDLIADAPYIAVTPDGVRVRVSGPTDPPRPAFVQFDFDQPIPVPVQGIGIDAGVTPGGRHTAIINGCDGVAYLVTRGATKAEAVADTLPLPGREDKGGRLHGAGGDAVCMAPNGDWLAVIKGGFYLHNGERKRILPPWDGSSQGARQLRNDGSVVWIDEVLYGARRMHGGLQFYRWIQIEHWTVGQSSHPLGYIAAHDARNDTTYLVVQTMSPISPRFAVHGDGTCTVAVSLAGEPVHSSQFREYVPQATPVPLPPEPHPTPAPPAPQPGPAPMERTLGQAVVSTIRAFESRFPLPRTEGGGPEHEDRCRDFMFKLAQQLRHSHRDRRFGVKRASEGRPRTKDALPELVDGRLFIVDIMLGAGTGRPSLVLDPNAHMEEATGQLFEDVSAVDHLGAGEPQAPGGEEPGEEPGGEPSTGGVPCEALEELRDAALQHALELGNVREAVAEAKAAIEASAGPSGQAPVYEGTGEFDLLGRRITFTIRMTPVAR